MTTRPYAELKALSQCHIILGVVMLVLSVLADYISSAIKTVRLSGLEECCSFYFLITGCIGLIGAISTRRGLVLAFILMSLHACLIFVPGIIIASSFDIHFYQHECFGECDWHLLATSMPNNSRCQILCGDALTDNQKSQMNRLGTDYRLDAGLITGAILELIVSILTVLLAGRYMCVSGDRRAKGSELVPLNIVAASDERR